MPDRLTPVQIRGARGMLGWSMTDLADAALVSVSTIKRMESGQTQPLSDDIYGLVRHALEGAGVRFMADGRGGEGIWLDPV